MRRLRGWGDYFTMPDIPSLDELLLSHAELRAALSFAGRRIGKLRRNDASLPLLRQTLKDARALARQFKAQAKASGA